MDRVRLIELARANGVSHDYHDIWGELREVPDEGLRAILAAMGALPALDGPAAAMAYAAALAAPLPAAIVLTHREGPQSIEVSAVRATGPLRWELTEEGGARHDGEIAHEPGAVATLALPALPPGYHRLSLHSPARALCTCLVIVAPLRCHQPDALGGGRRAWGPSVQLYALRSRRGWGIGDFTDLRMLARQSAALGASFVGLNPLHALRPDRPADASPYSPSSRRFLNYLYIDVESVEGFAQCAPLQALLQRPETIERLERLRQAELVDYEAVAAVKREALEMLFAGSRAARAVKGAEPAPAGEAALATLRAFRAEGGPALQRHALFEALQEHFALTTGAWGWPSWPAAYHDPHGEAATAFAREHAERVDFFAWLQWQATLQLARARAEGQAAGLSIGLYQDLAVSVDVGGAEGWSDRRVYAPGMSVGCPPDDFNLQGQDWGLPPFSPRRLREAAFAPFIAMLRACMREAGALRIDHVMGLARLFWIPREGGAAHGAYVQYPFEELLGILALESVRNRCMVVGEDLGTVPDEVRRAMHERGVFCYRVLLFTRRDGGAFARPWEYPTDALATATTHDLATLAGWWEERDIALRESLGLFPRPGMAQAQRDGRAHDRARLLEALHEEGLYTPLPRAQHGAGAGLPAEAPRAKAGGEGAGETDDGAISPPPMDEALLGAIQEFLARSNAPLLAVQLEDVFGCRDQVNLPGTVDEYPNWRRRLPVPLEDWDADGRWARMAERIRPGRGR
jgi:(1->4)-alpha-D-glucan 1-alpha-D-glucosylmutase